MMAAAEQTFTERYAQIHNADIDTITAAILHRQSHLYYAKAAHERVAEHLKLFKQADYAGTHRFFVEAIHVHPNIDGTDFTREELERAAKTLFRPINMDHDPKYGKGKHLPYPTNITLYMSWGPALEAVTGLIQVESRYASSIRRGEIAGVSVEYFSLGGVYRRGIVFSALALVTKEKVPADKRARIYGGSQS